MISGRTEITGSASLDHRHRQTHASGVVESRGQVKSATGAQRKRKTTVSKGPRRIVDPRDLQEFKDKGSRRAPHQRPRRVSLQPPASSSKDMHSELKQQTRRRSEPALSVSVCSDDFADRGVSREHRIQEHMKLTSGLSQNTPAQKHDGYHHNKNNRNHHKSQGGSGGRKVSFVPFLEETGLAPVREEESEID